MHISHTVVNQGIETHYNGLLVVLIVVDGYIVYKAAK